MSGKRLRSCVAPQVDDQVLRKLWLDESLTVAEIGRKLSASQWGLLQQARRLGLPRRAKRHRPASPDPTPAEIEAMCAQIQATRWNDDIREDRWQGKGVCGWRCPEVSLFLTGGDR